MTHYLSKIAYECRLMLTLVVLQSHLLNKVTWRQETERRTVVWCDSRSYLWLRKSFNICRLVQAQTRNSLAHKHTKGSSLLQMPESLSRPNRRWIWKIWHVWSVYRSEGLEQQLFWQNNLVRRF